MKSLLASFITLTFLISCQNQKKTSPTKESLYKLSLAQWSFNKSFKYGDVSPYEFAKMASELDFEGLEYVSQLYTDVMESDDKAAAIEAFVEKNNTLAAQYKMKNVLIMTHTISYQLHTLKMGIDAEFYCGSPGMVYKEIIKNILPIDFNGNFFVINKSA